MKLLFIAGMLLAQFFTLAKADMVSELLAHPQRSETDRKADHNRKPEALLRFSNIKPGDVVLDFFAGNGYNAELFSALVGEKGRVDVYNNRPYLDWIGNQLDTRYVRGYMTNTRRIESEVDVTKFSEHTYHKIIAVMALHDVYYADSVNGWPPIDKDKLYLQFFNALKNDGELIIIDHSAEAGSGLRDVHALHRIDEAYLIADLNKAGLVLTAEDNSLRNANDDRKLSSFDEKIRSRTDRFMLRFKKMENKTRASKRY